MTDVTVSSFVVPSARAELNGDLALDLHEIAKSLKINFFDAKKKLTDRDFLERVKNQGFRATAIAIANDSNGVEFESFILDVDAAKFFVAKYDNAIGDAYLAFLIRQENGHQKLTDLLLNDPRRVAAMLIEKANADDAIRNLALVNSYQNKALTTSQSRNAPLTVKVNKLETENRKLSDQVGDSNTWKRAIAARNMYKDVFSNLTDSGLGKLLTKTSRELGRQIQKIPDSKYGSVNAYHIEVVKKAAQEHAALRFVMSEQMM